MIKGSSTEEVSKDQVSKYKKEGWAISSKYNEKRKALSNKERSSLT